MPWYTVDNVADVPSPALLVYPERVAQNIRAALRIVGDARRLRPHLKTSKMSEVVRMHLDEGITRFKCATIAEAEMAARAGAPDVLLAYQPVGPNVARFVRLVQAFPATRFAAIVDDTAMVDALSAAAVAGRRHAGPVPRPRRRHAPERHRAGPRGGGAVSMAVDAARAARRRPAHVRRAREGDRRGRTPAGVRRRLRARRDDAAGDHGGRARRAVRRGRGHAGLPVPRAARRRRVQPGDDGLLGCRLRRDAAGSPVRAGGRVADARDQQTGGEPAVPGPRAQGGRGGEPASARGAVRARGRDGGRPQRGAPRPRDRPRRRLPCRHGGLWRALARVPDGGPVQRGGRGPRRPRRREMAGGRPRQDRHTHNP